MTWSRASRTSMWTMSNTSVEPRGVLGGGKGLITDPDRVRPDIKLSRRSRFLVLLAGDAGPSSRAICVMRGRDATESSDQRDARHGSTSSPSGFSIGEELIASPGVTMSSDSGVTVVSLIGEGSRGLPTEKDGDGVDASSASLRN